MKKLLLAIPVLIDNNQCLSDCLESFFEQSLYKKEEADVYVIVNNEKDETLLDQIDKFDDGYAIMNADNLGVSGSWNQAILTAKNDGYEYVCCVGFDTVFKDTSLLENAVNVMDESGADFGRGGALSFNFWMVKPETFVIKVGLFDENFYPAYWEDLDMMRRIRSLREHGIMKSVLFDDAGKIEHKQSRTVNDHTEIIPHDVWNYTYTQNQLYYRAKWGTDKSGLEEGYTTPFNNPRCHLSFWVSDPNRILRNKEKWDACINK